jgi:hypothetical protein
MPRPARSLAQQGVHQIFTAVERLQESAIPASLRPGIAKTRAPPAFPAKLLLPTAQKPVTRLWTACTRLKINQIRRALFSLTPKLESVQQDRSLTVS